MKLLASQKEAEERKRLEDAASFSFKPETHPVPDFIKRQQQQQQGAGGAPRARSLPKSTEQRQLEEATFRPKISTASAAAMQQQHQQPVLERMQKREQDKALRLQQKRDYLLTVDASTGRPLHQPAIHALPAGHRLSHQQ